MLCSSSPGALCWDPRCGRGTVARLLFIISLRAVASFCRRSDPEIVVCSWHWHGTSQGVAANEPKTQPAVVWPGRAGERPLGHNTLHRTWLFLSRTFLTVPDEQSVATMDESSSLFHLLAESKRLGYSAVIAALLLFVCAIHAARQSPGKLALPLYKASKTKWIFDAETLVRDSYQKVVDVPEPLFSDRRRGETSG